MKTESPDLPKGETGRSTHSAVPSGPGELVLRDWVGCREIERIPMLLRRWVEEAGDESRCSIRVGGGDSRGNILVMLDLLIS